MTGIVERLRAWRDWHDNPCKLHHEAAALIEELVEGLRPFADCCEYISDDEDDEEWAKFRLLIKDYRRAKAVVAKVKGEE